MTRTLSYIFFSLILIFPLDLSAATYSPSTKWRQYKTEHFVIVYPHELDGAYIKKVEQVAEEAYGKVTTFLDHKPSRPVYLVIKDDVDSNNGSATLIPKKQIGIYMSPAVNGDELWDTRARDDLKLLLQHELTHIVHLDTRGGIFKYLAAVFGPAFSPNLFLPPSIIEGLAVYSETEYENGRGMGTLYEMILRTDVLEGNIKSIDKTVIFPREWPAGTIPYMYGYKFIDYLAKTYGKEKLAEISHTTGRRFPFFLSGAFLKVYEKRLETLWKEWKETLPAIYEAQKNSLLSDGETSDEVIFKSGGSANNLLLSPDDQTLYFYWHGNDNYPALVSLDLKSLKLKKLSKGSFSGRISITGDGKRLYYAKTEPYRHFLFYSDIYYYDLEKKRETRLTKGKRAGDAAVDLSGRYLVYTRQSEGIFYLERLDMETGETFAFPKIDGVFLWHSPVFSQYDGRLAVMGQTLDGVDSLYLWEDNEKWRKLEISSSWASDPSFSPDAKNIYFTTDINGAPNIYSYSFDDGSRTRKTSVYSGAFFGVSDGEKLYYSKYTSNGFVIEKTPLADEFGKEKEKKRGQAPFFKVPVPFSFPEEKITAKRYNPLKQLIVPYSLIPITGTDEDGWQAGIYLAGEDVLGHHSYQIQTLYGFDSKRPTYEIEYVYNRLYPTISISTFDYANLFGGVFNTNYWERKRGGDIGFDIPIFSTNRNNISMNASYLFQNISALTSPIPTPAPFEGNYSAIAGGANWSFLESHRYSLWPAKGIIVDGIAERADRKIGGGFSRTKLLSEIQLYIPSLFKRHVFSLTGRGGVSYGETLPQGDFKVGGDINLDILHPENDFFSLRGYPARSLTGSRFAVGQAEYRMPLVFIERGIGHGPIHLDSIALASFYDIGSAWDKGQNKPFRDSFGGEIQSKFKLGYYMPLTLRIGIARGLRETGKTSYYFGTRGAF